MQMPSLQNQNSSFLHQKKIYTPFKLNIQIGNTSSDELNPKVPMHLRFH